MRTFVILLILANLGYLAWQLYVPGDPATVLVREPSRQSGQTLSLLSEVSGGQQDMPPEPQTCLSLGVFKNTEESDFLVSALLERGMKSRVELVQAGDAVTFRVYMPPFNSDSAARQALESLQAGGFDSFIIGSGDLAGGISLGLFTREDLALALQERLAGDGFATSIQEITTSNNQIWVTVEGLSQTLLEGSDLLDLLSRQLDLEVVQKPCETIASSP